MNKLNTFISSIVTVLVPPLTLLNIFAGIIGGIWVLFYGAWDVAFYAILLSITGVFIASVSVFPSMIALPIILWAEKHKNRFFLVFGALVSSTLTSVAIYFVTLNLYSFIIGINNELPRLAIALLAYGVTTGPWKSMAASEKSEGSVIVVFFISIGIAIVTLVYSITGVLALGWLFIAMVVYTITSTIIASNLPLDTYNEGKDSSKREEDLDTNTYDNFVLPLSVDIFKESVVIANFFEEELGSDPATFDKIVFELLNFYIFYVDRLLFRAFGDEVRNKLIDALAGELFNTVVYVMHKDKDEDTRNQINLDVIRKYNISIAKYTKIGLDIDLENPSTGESRSNLLLQQICELVGMNPKEPKVTLPFYVQIVDSLNRLEVNKRIDLLKQNTAI